MADEDLTMQAVQELQKDAERAKDRSTTLGATGWKRRIATTNRVYLHNTIIGNMQANKRITKNLKRSSVDEEDSSESYKKDVHPRKSKGFKHENDQKRHDDKRNTSSCSSFKKTSNKNPFDVPGFFSEKRKVKKSKTIESEDSDESSEFEEREKSNQSDEKMELSEGETKMDLKEEDSSDFYMIKRKKKKKRKNLEVEKSVRYKRQQNKPCSGDNDRNFSAVDKMMEVSHTVSRKEMDIRKIDNSSEDNRGFKSSFNHIDQSKNLIDNESKINTNNYLERIDYDDERFCEEKYKNISEEKSSDKKLKTKSEKLDSTFISKRSHKRKFLISSSDSNEEAYLCKKMKRKKLLDNSKVVHEKEDKVSDSDQEMFIPVNINKKLKMSHDSQADPESESDWEEKIVYPPPRKVSSTDNDEEMAHRSRRYPNYNLYRRRMKNSSDGETTYKHKEEDDGIQSLPLAISKNVTITEDAYTSHLVISKNRSKISQNSRLFNIAVNGINKTKSEQAKTIEVDFSCRLELGEKSSTITKPNSKRKFHGEKDNLSS